jgi:hypothetical protein
MSGRTIELDTPVPNALHQCSADFLLITHDAALFRFPAHEQENQPERH